MSDWEHVEVRSDTTHESVEMEEDPKGTAAQVLADAQARAWEAEIAQRALNAAQGQAMAEAALAQKAVEEAKAALAQQAAEAALQLK
jgi:hypothetical protein